MQIINGWIDEALDGHYGAKSNSRNGQKPKYLVLHATAGGSSAQGIDDFFTNGLDANGQPVQASSHIIIDQAGVVIQGISLDMAAWANCCLSGNHAPYLDTTINQNEYTISIEFVKASTDNSDALTDIQARKGFEVTACICDAYNIPKHEGDSNGGIISHADIDPVNRSRCPGTFPWDALYAFLNGETNTMLELTDSVVQTYFTDGGNGSWKCKKNGVILFGGNLGFYRANNGLTLFGLPLSNEIYLPQYPGTAIVPCERVMIVWDPNKIIDNPPNSGPTYLLHIDGGIGQQLLMQSAQSSLASELAAANKKLDLIKQIVE